ncbi:MAG: hypothetical protein P8016_07155, partial [Sedimentisphaerales bacterium]
MRHKKSSKRIIFDFNILYISLLSLLIAGCRKQPQLIDPNMALLETWSEKTWLTNDSIKLFKTAITLYKNNTVDLEPLLLAAWISKSYGVEESNLGLAIYDEQQDVVGIIVKEQLNDPNGTVKILYEDYPVFIYHPS